MAEEKTDAEAPKGPVIPEHNGFAGETVKPEPEPEKTEPETPAK